MRLAISLSKRGLTLLAVIFLLAACRTTSVVPSMDTAREQFIIAASAEAKDIPPVDASERIKHRKRQRIKYEKVIERFPDDPVYTPEAVLGVARMLGKEKRHRMVIRYLQQARPLYPVNEYFQARALLYIGQAMDSRKKYEQAKQMYRECYDRYHLSVDRQTVDVADECRRLFFVTYIDN